ncbi:MAG: hypothetical protein HOI19_02845, partial [Rhodospirillaceae bacterium]|nr:hypothetical protein [Rhodospirillaceae bacterium]
AKSEPVAEDEVFPTSTIAAILDYTPEAKTVDALKMPAAGIELTPVDMERLALARNIKGKRRMATAPTVKRPDDVRRFAARILGDVGKPGVASALETVLADKDEEVRMAAADSLARIGEHAAPFPASVSDALMEALKSAKPSLKILLIRALAASSAENVIDVLKMQLTDEDSFIRTEAVHALRKLGQVGPEIEALLEDPDPSVRLGAAEAVVGAGGEDAIQRIVDFAFSFEGYHSRQAARLLRRLDIGEASQRFMDVLRDPERKRTWSVAIEALKELNISRHGPVELAAVRTAQ